VLGNGKSSYLGSLFVAQAVDVVRALTAPSDLFDREIVGAGGSSCELQLSLGVSDPSALWPFLGLEELKPVN
jgi:hypothetical protein